MAQVIVDGFVPSPRQSRVMTTTSKLGMVETLSSTPTTTSTEKEAEATPRVPSIRIIWDDDYRVQQVLQKRKLRRTIRITKNKRSEERTTTSTSTSTSTSPQRLKLDEEGRLRVGDTGPILLDGLSSTVWSGIEPVKSNRDKSSLADSLDDDASAGVSSLILQTTCTGIQRAHHHVSLGNLVTCSRLLSCARLTRYWMGPAFGTSSKDVPLDTQFLLVELSNDNDGEGAQQEKQYALMLPLVDAGFRASLEYGDSNSKKMELICYSESGDASVFATPNGKMKALYVAVGNDPFKLLQVGFQQVADTMGTFQTLSKKKIPSSVNDFGWCTWDAFYSDVNPKGILEGVQALKKLGVPPKNLILDDGWQEVSPKPSNWEDGNSDGSAAADDTTPSMMSRVGNALFDPIARGVTAYYDGYVKRARHGSLPNRIWTAAAKYTPLKDGLWKFFDSETDFGRQLDSFTPNYKFRDSLDNNKEGGTMSLKNLVSILKNDYDLKRVYCWHALHGYWRGVTTELGNSIGINVTQIMTKPTNHMLRVEPQMGFDTPSLFGVGMISSERDLDVFYEHLHKPLVEAGVDGVKVDVQSGVSAAGSGVGGGPHVAKIYTQAMEKSVSKNFREKQTSDDNGSPAAIETINCMCHSTENLYRYKVTALARASDDFYPARPESHSVHLINVAYNSLFLGEICLPDWDMFHSKHQSAGLHAAARAIGGCPVYVSDKPGEHDGELLKKLVLPDGSILRAQLPGRPTRDCLFVDVGQDKVSAMKIWNQNRAVAGRKDGGGGVVGAFNVQGVAWNFDTNENEVVNASPQAVTASVKPHDVETLRNIHGPFAAWSHRTQKLQVLPTGDSTIDTELDHREWEIFTIEPVQQYKHISWAPIGLGDMMNSGGALTHVGPLEHTTTTKNSTIDGSADGAWRQTTTAEISTRGPGRFVAYCNPAPSSIMIDDGVAVPSELSFSYQAETGQLEFHLPHEAREGKAHQVTVVWDHSRGQ